MYEDYGAELKVIAESINMFDDEGLHQDSVEVEIRHIYVKTIIFIKQNREAVYKLL